MQATSTAVIFASRLQLSPANIFAVLSGKGGRRSVDFMTDQGQAMSGLQTILIINRYRQLANDANSHVTH